MANYRGGGNNLYEKKLILLSEVEEMLVKFGEKCSVMLAEQQSAMEAN